MKFLKNLTLVATLSLLSLACSSNKGDSFDINNAPKNSPERDSSILPPGIPDSHPLVRGPLPAEPGYKGRSRFARSFSRYTRSGRYSSSNRYADGYASNRYAVDELPVDPRGPKVPTRCNIQGEYITYDGQPLEHVEDDRERTDRLIELEDIGLCTRANTRCRISGRAFLIDGKTIQTSNDSRELVERWIEIERTELCVHALSRCSVDKGYVTMDGRPIEYVGNSEGLIDRWIELERSGLCTRAATYCNIEGTYITLNGRRVERVEDERERLRRLVELEAQGFCSQPR